MLRFFRHIRKKLMEQNKVRTYILYAIGEIFLVVIGILIALQVNNWNEERKERRIERQILQQVYTDLQGAMEDISSNIEFVDKAIESADILVLHMDGNQPYHDSIGVHLSNAFLSPKLIIDMGGYESMKSEGIDIITNKALKNQIINFFEGRLYFHRKYESLLTNSHDIVVNREGPLYFKGMYQDSGFSNGEYYSGISEPHDYNKLRKDETFRYRLITLQAFNKSFQQLTNIPNMQMIEELMLAIENELSAI